ncbi:hypothetical protein IMZ48_10685 [Candidatus Bathyarchaeota archaeon]|nr:hypothetical protein [Candidatus Bathyarchaeota archaeon]
MPSIEAQVDFALCFMDKIQREGVKSVAVSQAANTEFNDHKDAVMELLTFSGNCNSWYVFSALHETGLWKVANSMPGTRVARQTAGSSGRGRAQSTTSWTRSGIRVSRISSLPTLQRTDSRIWVRGSRYGTLRRRSWDGTSGGEPDGPRGYLDALAALF